MARQPIIPPQSGNGTPAHNFDALAKRLLAVPKSEIDREEKKEARQKKPKHT
jgi:hypothetical protein